MYFKKLILLFLCCAALYNKADAQSQKATFFLQTDFDQLYLNDSVKISKCAIYLTNFKFYNQAQLVFEDTIKAHLVDLLDPNPIQFNIAANLVYNRVTFNIGVDSNTNVAGILTGDLDPRKGMYWAWQSGYINFKIEGKSKICKTRNNVFQYHVGGYSSPYTSIQYFKFPILKTDNVTIEIPLDDLLERIDIRTTNEVMSPSAKSTQIANQFSEIIQIK
jgi:hypothetical protein